MVTGTFSYICQSKEEFLELLNALKLTDGPILPKQLVSPPLPHQTPPKVGLSEATSVAGKQGDYAAPSGKGQNRHRGPHEIKFEAKHGPARIRKSMIKTLGLSGNREDMFEQLYDKIESGEVKRGPGGYTSNRSFVEKFLELSRTKFVRVTPSVKRLMQDRNLTTLEDLCKFYIDNELIDRTKDPLSGSL